MSQTITKTEKITLLSLGDSYTIGESVAPMQSWPFQLVGKLRDSGFKCDDPKIIATTGWRTDDLKRAILAQQPSKDFNLVSLLIGVNNQYQGKSAKSYKPEFEELLQIAILHASGDPTKVFVVSIPDYGYTPFGKAKQQTISKEIDEFNLINKSIAEKYGIQYFYITDISRQAFNDPMLVASDGLHPSGKMYGQWADVIAKGLIQKLR